MGMYDMIEYTCSNCAKDTYAQTKLASCMMDLIKVGDIFLESNISINLIVKDGCDKCQSKNCIMIKDGKIIQTVPLKEATHQEERFGNVTKLNDGDSNGDV